MPTEMEDYLFDLRGFLILENAVDPDTLSKLDAEWNALPAESGNHNGVNAKFAENGATFACENSYHIGPTFESLIDHPSWLDYVHRYIGGDDGLRMQRAFSIRRGPGGASLPHSGGHKRRIYTQFRYHDGQFRCGQVNIILAHKDIGEGDGCTVVIPGSHKANLQHPQFHFDRRVANMDNIVARHPVHLKAGDALLFVDCLAHGAEERKNPGYRETTILRYGPQWAMPEGGVFPSKAFLNRTTEARRRLLEPVPAERIQENNL